MFESLIGNERMKSHIGQMLASGRLPRAAIFAGPRGVGKTRFAFETARALVCAARTGCGACAACVRTAQAAVPDSDRSDDYKRVFFGAHPDIGVVAAYSRSIFVDAIRDLEKEANFRPFDAAVRVFVIDEADKMNEAAANALLKTLEEPPATTYLFLVTARPDALLPTIRSRAQILRFVPIATAEIELLLCRGSGLAADDARLAARLAGGSVASALACDVAKLKQRRDEMLEVIDAATKRQIAVPLRTSERLSDAKHKDDFEENLSVLETLLRDIWLISGGAAIDLLVNIDLADRLQALAAKTKTDAVASLLSEIEMIRQRFAVNINRRVATDALFVKMTVAADILA